MKEISLNILDIAQNSIRAGAGLIEISVRADIRADRLMVTVRDDGGGMTSEQLKKAEDPFFTTRTTRGVGMGVSFFKMSAELTGGKFYINSVLGEGTEVTAEYVISSVDRMPLGDMAGTMLSLISMNAGIEFLYKCSVDGREFKLDTREFKAILGGIRLDSPEILAYIKEFLTENMREADGGAEL